MVAVKLSSFHRVRWLAVAVSALVSLGGCPTGSNNNANANANANTNTNGNSNSNSNANSNANDNTSGGTTADVDIQAFAFDPKELHIKPNTTVRWTNKDSFDHTVTSGNPGDSNAGSVFSSGTLGANQTFSHTFTAVGEFIYFCEIHGPSMATMRGAKVIVEQ